MKWLPVVWVIAYLICGPANGKTIKGQRQEAINSGAALLQVLPGASDVQLCHRFAKMYGRIQNEIKAPDSPVAYVRFDPIEQDMPGFPGYGRTLPIGPHGKPMRLVTWGFNGSATYDGDTFVVAPIDASDQHILDLGEQLHTATPVPWPRDWTVLSGGTPELYPKVLPQFVHISALRIDDRFYFEAWPANVENKPSHVLASLGPDLKLKTICRFEWVGSTAED